MKFPIPVVVEGTEYTDADVRCPTPGCLADTERVVKDGKQYTALVTFAAGGITALYGTATTSEPSHIAAACRAMPWKTNEAVCLEMLKKHHGDKDKIEGVYSCPRCGNQLIEGEDTDDRLSALLNTVAPGVSFAYVFPDELVVKDKDGNTLITVNNLELRYPLMSDCIAAESKVGSANSMRLQMAIFNEALIAVNGVPFDAKARASIGKSIWEQIPSGRAVIDMAELADQYGVQKTVDKICPKCDKKWKAVLNTRNFFASALQV